MVDFFGEILSFVLMLMATETRADRPFNEFQSTYIISIVLQYLCLDDEMPEVKCNHYQGSTVAPQVLKIFVENVMPLYSAPTLRGLKQ